MAALPCRLNAKQGVLLEANAQLGKDDIGLIDSRRV